MQSQPNSHVVHQMTCPKSNDGISSQVIVSAFEDIANQMHCVVWDHIVVDNNMTLIRMDATSNDRGDGRA